MLEGKHVRTRLSPSGGVCVALSVTWLCIHRVFPRLSLVSMLTPSTDLFSASFTGILFSAYSTRIIVVTIGVSATSFTTLVFHASSSGRDNTSRVASSGAVTRKSLFSTSIRAIQISMAIQNADGSSRTLFQPNVSSHRSHHESHNWRYPVPLA